MSTVVDLSSLGSGGFVIQGDTPEDNAGWSVAGVGDINGDGFDDFIIGAPFFDTPTAGWLGRAYVIFGGATGFANIDLGNLQPADGFLIQGDGGADFAGISVSAAGDVNGDGFDDMIVGSLHWEHYYSAATTAYVLFGKASGFGTVDLAAGLAPSAGFAVHSNYTASYGATSVASAGDINGDGFDDLLVGAMYDNGFAGAAYVVFGHGSGSGFGTIDLTNMAASVGFEITGVAGSGTGRSVAGAGDVNGDGFDDIIVGAPYGDIGGAEAGQAYVIFGKASGFGPIDLANLAPGSGFMIQGDQAGDFLGFSVSGAGDFNGDGFDDLIVGASNANANDPLAGQAYILWGKASGFGTIDLSNLSPGSGFKIIGDDTADHLGWSVSAAGDVNHDGLADIIIGAPENDQNRDGTRIIDGGEAYVIFGRSPLANYVATIDVTNLSPSEGFVIQGETAYDLAGWSVAGAGDIDGDGFDDLLIAAPHNDRGGTNAGAAYLLSGRLDLGTEARSDFNGDGRSDILWRNDDGTLTNWLGQQDGSLTGNSANFAAGVSNDWTVAGTGDFNGDHRDDILWRNTNGTVSDWLGQSNGGFVSNSGNFVAGVAAEWTIVGIGDFNGDFRDDILWRNTNGLVSDWLGQANGGFLNNGANFGAAVAAEWTIAAIGDFNGDARDDILWRNANGTITDWLGTANGGFTPNNHNFVAGVGAEWTVIGVGDFNGDRRDDILWQNTNGAVTDWLGTRSGSFTPNNANFILAVTNDWSIVQIADFNGDNRDDILWRNTAGGVTNWLGAPNGGFTNNFGHFGAIVANDWHVQAPELL